MKKKLLSVFLAVVMALTLVTPMTAMADETPDVSIGTAQELVDFATASHSATYEGKLIVLTADIDMDGVSSFTGIGANVTGGDFRGTFDGQGHTVSNLSWTVTGKPNGFFNIVGNGAVIRNLTLENYSLTGSQSGADERHGLLVGTHYSNGPLTVSNVHIVNGSYTNTSANGAGSIGGLVGASLNALTIENCSVEADITIQNPSATNAVNSANKVDKTTVGVGGIVGRMNGDYARTISGCSFTGTISAGRCVGGIFGKNMANSTRTQEITNCTVNATINGAHQAVGGIGGYGLKVRVSGCTFTGNITDTYTDGRNIIGGILGEASGATIEDCVFNGDLTASGGPAAAGGILGQAATGTVTLNRCETFGTVYGGFNQMGGLVGCTYADENSGLGTIALTLTDCFSSVNIQASGQSGAGVGRLASGTANAYNCVALRGRFTDDSIIGSFFNSGKSGADASGTSTSATNCMVSVNLVAGDTNVGAQTYHVTTAQQLYAIARMSKWTTFRSNTFELDNDIALNAANVNAAVASDNTSALTVWPMIGREAALGSSNTAPYFLGTFEGNDHTVSGAYVPTHNEIGAGLFALVGSGSTIRNFTLANSYFHTDNSVSNVSRIGAVVGDIKASATVSGVTVSSDVTVSGVNPQVGGIAGCAEDTATITDCAFNGAVSSTSGYVGGILGCNITAGTTTITDCSFGGSVEGAERVGGIIGNCARAVNITNAVSAGTVTGTKASGWARTGGVIGFVAAAATINGLTDSAAVIAPNGGYDVGGVVGAQNQALTITDANVTATVTVDTDSNSTIIGGMIGAIRGAYTATVTNSRFGGTVNRTSDAGGTPYIGGVVGSIVNSTGALSVSHFLMDGTLEAVKNAYIGGIAAGSGQLGVVNISDTLVTGSLTAPGGQVGAFLGLTDSGETAHLTGSVTDSYALDTVCTNAKSAATNGLLGKYPHVIIFEGEVEALTGAQLTGANALLNAPTLDYDGYWAAIQDATPQLKTFKTGTDADDSNLLARTGATAPAAPAGKVFGGWYADAEFTTPVAPDYTGLAFAKFVDDDVLSVKSQKGLTKTDDGKTRLRIVTSVDSLDYQEVGFHITYNNASGVEKTVTARATTVYATLIGYTDPSTSETYHPTVFSDESIRFVAFRLVASDAVVAQNGAGISVQPYWITADGVTVEGETFSGIQF